MSAEPSRSLASYAQERVWLASQMARDAPLYHVADDFMVHARTSEGQLRTAFETVAGRHGSLRTCLRVIDGALLQIVYPSVEPALESADLRGLEPGEQARVREAVSARLVYAPFDLARAPLWRAALFRVADDGWAVQFVAHHAVFDPESGLNLHAEITELCAAAEQGREAKLPRLPLTYAAYATLQRRRLSGPRGAYLREFWRERLRGLAPVHAVPLDRSRPAHRTFAGAELRDELSTATVRAVTELARRHRTVDFTVLLAAYSVLLYRRSGRDEIAVGVPAAGRDEPESRAMLGAFVNMLVLRLDLAGDPSLAELVIRVRDRAAEAWAHQDLPFQSVVEDFAGRRPPGVAPLYQCAFNARGTRLSGPRSSTAEDELLLEVADRDLRLEYNTTLFDARTARALLDEYVRILDAGLAEPEVPLSRMPPTAAREPAHRDATAVREVRPPRTRWELAVAQVWSEVLGAPAGGVFDDFFGLGGHSLQVLRVLAGIAVRTGARLTVQAFFADPTIAGLAAEIERIIDGRTT